MLRSRGARDDITGREFLSQEAQYFSDFVKKFHDMGHVKT